MAQIKFRHLIIFPALFFLIATGCSSSAPPQEPSEPLWAQKYLVGAYYYLWYPGNWRDGYINGLLTPPQKPALGEYDSSDLNSIEQHIAWSSQYGLHFWAISWWPGQPDLDRVLREKITKARNIDDIKFCIFYETSGLGLVNDQIVFNPDRGRKMVSDFNYLAQTYFSHPSYLKVNGRPVVIIYLTRTFSGDYPEAIGRLRESLKAMGFDPYLIGDEIFWNVLRSAPLPPSTHPNMNRIRLFDAITAYNMYDWAKPKQMGYGNTSTFLQDVHDLYREYQSAMGKKIPLIPAIIPGYNDRGVRLSEKHPVIPRQFQPGAEEGSFFRQALRRTVVPFVASAVPMALITSFNEWNEGTQIEPTIITDITQKDLSPSQTDYTQGYAFQGYGEKYLSILQDTFIAIGGRVTEEGGGKPLYKVQVKAFKGEGLKAATKTDSQGHFNLSRINLPPGEYDITADMAGYKQIRSRILVEEKQAALLRLKITKE